MKRFQIEYSFDARRKRNHIRGFVGSETMSRKQALGAACAAAVRHIARSEFDSREYHAAVIIDRRTGKMVRKYHLNSHGTIVCTDYERDQHGTAEVIQLRAARTAGE